MPAKRELSMRQLRHLLRLHHDGVSAREIGRRLGVARSTIQDNLKRAATAGLAWPLGTASPTRLWSANSLVAPGSRKASGGGSGQTGLPWRVNEASSRHDDDPLGGIGPAVSGVSLRFQSVIAIPSADDYRQLAAPLR